MKIAGDRHIAAPQTVVESVLRDGRRLARAIPDFRLGAPLDEQCQRGTLTIRVGPMRGQYEGVFTITESERVVWEIVYDGHSAQGILKGHGRIYLTPYNEQTIIQYEVDIEAAGQLANLPPRLLYANINAIIRRCLDGIERVLWPEKFVAEPVGSREGSKMAVPGFILLLGTFLLIYLFKKRKK